MYKLNLRTKSLNKSRCLIFFGKYKPTSMLSPSIMFFASDGVLNHDEVPPAIKVS